MKSDSPVVHPLPGDEERSQLDWPFHAGLVDRIWAKVEVKVKRRQVRRRRMATGVAGIALIAFTLLWGVPYARDTGKVVTVAANRQTLVLADGSQAELNAQTNVHTDFRYGRRVVRLDRGEAFFAVARDATRPFLVETPVGTVRVTGTQFNVRLVGDRVEVTLLEGSVEFEGAGTAPLHVALASGQQLDTSRPDLLALSATDLENVTAWRQGRLVLDGLSLSEVAARLAAYHGTEITVNADARTLRPGGSVSLDNLPGALDALQDTLPIRVMTNGDGSLRVVRR